MISGERSSEQSSEIRISKSEKLCDRADSIAWERKASPLNTGMHIETYGAAWLSFWDAKLLNPHFYCTTRQNLIYSTGSIAVSSIQRVKTACLYGSSLPPVYINAICTKGGEEPLP